jgi:hypothetical protein
MIVTDTSLHCRLDTPFERQQFHTRMLEHGVIPWWTARAAELTELSARSGTVNNDGDRLASAAATGG